LTTVGEDGFPSVSDYDVKCRWIRTTLAGPHRTQGTRWLRRYFCAPVVPACAPWWPAATKEATRSALRLPESLLKAMARWMRDRPAAACPPGGRQGPARVLPVWPATRRA